MLLISYKLIFEILSKYLLFVFFYVILLSWILIRFKVDYYIFGMLSKFIRVIFLRLTHSTTLLFDLYFYNGPHMSYLLLYEEVEVDIMGYGMCISHSMSLISEGWNYSIVRCGCILFKRPRMDAWMSLRVIYFGICMRSKNISIFSIGNIGEHSSILAKDK